MRHLALIPILTAVLVGDVLAQQPTLALSTLTPIQTSAQLGTQNTANTIGGPLPASGGNAAVVGSTFGPHASAQVDWFSSVDAVGAAASFTQRLRVSGTATGAAGAGPHDVLVTLTSPVPRAVTLRITLAAASTPGLPAATAEVDLDNDGAPDYWGSLHAGTYERSAWIGAQPLLVRVRIAAAIPLGQTGSIDTQIHVAARPDNGLLILPAGAGCLDNGVNAMARWDDFGVHMGPLSLISPPAAPWVFAVAALEAAPTLLPSIGSPLPCLLLPRPDVVSMQMPFSLGIPPAVRPITVWMQYVVLQANGVLGTANAYVVHAQP